MHEVLHAEKTDRGRSRLKKGIERMMSKKEEGEEGPGEGRSGQHTYEIWRKMHDSKNGRRGWSSPIPRGGSREHCWRLCGPAGPAARPLISNSACFGGNLTLSRISIPRLGLCLPRCRRRRVPSDRQRHPNRTPFSNAVFKVRPRNKVPVEGGRRGGKGRSPPPGPQPRFLRNPPHIYLDKLLRALTPYGGNLPTGRPRT